MQVRRKIETFVRNVPFLVSGLKKLGFRKTYPSNFESSSQYWENRYALKGDSGDGSYGHLAHFKAEIINDFVTKFNIASIIEFGCGDGAQLEFMKYPSYVGVDVSHTIIDKCRQDYSSDPSKTFVTTSELDTVEPKYDLALSLDVIYHLVEDSVFDQYMKQLFAATDSWIIIYSSNFDEAAEKMDHVRHRKFTTWIEQNCPEWEMHGKVDQRYPFDPAAGDRTSLAEFYIFVKKSNA